MRVSQSDSVHRNRKTLVRGVCIWSVAVGLVLAGRLWADDREAFVRTSPRDPRYFELSNGKPYIPIGLNMVRPPRDDLAGMEEWLKRLSANGGNFARIWLSSPFFDIEHTQ